MRRTLLPLAVSLAAALLVPALAGAHALPAPAPPVPVVETVDAGPAPVASTMPWLALVVVAALLATGARLGCRRWLMLTLALLLAIAALEHGVHSVHHLGRPETTCVVNAVTDSVVVVLDVAAPGEPHIPSRPGGPPRSTPAPLPALAAGPDPARAPPPPRA